MERQLESSREVLKWMNAYARPFNRYGYKYASLSKKFALATLAISGAIFVGATFCLLAGGAIAGLPTAAVAAPAAVSSAKHIFWSSVTYLAANFTKASFQSNAEQKAFGLQKPDWKAFGQNLYNEFARDYGRVMSPRFS